MKKAAAHFRGGGFFHKMYWGQKNDNKSWRKNLSKFGESFKFSLIPLLFYLAQKVRTEKMTIKIKNTG